MTLQILPKQSATKAGSGAREIFQHLEEHQVSLGLENALAFYNFPLFREDEHLLVAEIVLISPSHGVVMISSANSMPNGDDESTEAQNQLEGAFSQVFSRLVKYQRLRQGRAQLSFPIDAVLWIPESTIASGESVIVGVSALNDYFIRKRLPSPISDSVFAELTSVLDGSKALIRPKERKTTGFQSNSKIGLAPFPRTV